MSAENIEEGRELLSAESGTVALLNKSEIDMQIATAHKYPRSIKKFRNNVQDMVTISETVAQECIYAIPRDGKMIEGPSARFAEVVASAWGNSRAGARVVSDVGDFVTAQGVFHDLENNVAITYEVQRRIVDKQGRRFKPDMIGVTANAACSIALRNAILKGVPKAFWSDMYAGARQCAMGDVKTLPTRRAEAFKSFQNYGITKEQVLAKLKLAGEEDIGQEELVTLRAIITAIKDGDTTPEQAFAPDINLGETSAQKLPYPADQFNKSLAGWKKLIKDGKKTAEQIIVMAQTKGILSEEQLSAIRAPIDNGENSLQGEGNTPASVAALNALLEKAKSAAITDADIAKHMGVSNLDGFTVSQVQRALEFINNPTGK